MHVSFLLQVLLICTCLLIEGHSKTRNRRVPKIVNPVFVEINPGIFQSQNVIKIDSLEKRPKRDKVEENPSLVLEFTPGFFSNPKLKDLYDAITGAHESNQETFSKDKSSTSDETKMILQINPLKIENLNLKRDLFPKKNSKDTGGFSLKINPESPSRHDPVRINNGTCSDKPPDEIWCMAHVKTEKCPETEPTIPTTTTCHPTKPRHTTKKLHFCEINWNAHRISLNPCESTTIPICTTEEYTQCKSSEPPSVMPSWGPATLAPCKDHETTTSTAVEEVTTTVPVTQNCDVAQRGSADQGPVESDRYFILFKRSPSDSWSKTIRKKRDHPLGIFKFKLVPN